MRRNLPFFALFAAVAVMGIAFSAAQTRGALPLPDANHFGEGGSHLKVGP